MPTSRHLSNATTFLARCPSSLINALSSTLERNSGLRTITKNHTLLFTIAPSSTTSPELLSQLTSALTRISPAHVGCISAPLSHQFFGSNIHPGHNACSFSYAIVNGTSFRSTIPGRAEPQVGRWHAGRRRNTDHEGLERESGGTGVDVEHAEARVFADGSGPGGEVDWEKVWDRSARSMSFGMGSERNALPDTLKNIDPSTVDNIIYFSDRAPEGISSVLESAFPRANKLSLIASSTPFLTGRPVTLFHNGEVLSDGAVGVALSASSSSPSVDLSFPPLVALTPELVVTSAEGNLILSLDSGNPTRLLLAAIQKHGLSLSGGTTWVGKEDEFYVGVVDPQTNEMTQLHRINSGDPSRGTIALDTGSAPRKGCVVRLYHLPRQTTSSASPYTPNPASPSLSFFVTPETLPDAEPNSAPTPEVGGKISEVSVLPDSFLAASENGFTLSLGSEEEQARGPWTCVVPGGRAGLSWAEDTSR